MNEIRGKNMSNDLSKSLRYGIMIVSVMEFGAKDVL